MTRQTYAITKEKFLKIATLVILVHEPNQIAQQGS
jgi:hypothetical protein